MFRRTLEYYANRFHPKQTLAWLAFKAGLDLVLAWGRRSGKTELCIEILIEDIEDRGHPCLYVAKTQKQARKIVWPKLKKRLKGNKDWKLKDSSMEAVHLPSDTELSVYGADLVPDNMTGSGYRIIVCDEFALWKKPEIVGEILAPMLGDFVGQFVYISTKRGKNHFYQLEKRARAEPEKYFFLEATIFDNAFLSDAGRAKVLSEYEGGELNPLYQQEILNKYVVFEGMAFALKEEDYTERRWDPADLENSLEHVRMVDHGYSPDPTACLWMAYNERKGYWQVYADYRQPALLIKTHADAILTAEPYKIDRTISDVDPQVIAEYADVKLHMSPAQKADKKARILRVVNALRSGKLKIAHNCKLLLEEMSSYEWDQDHNDDCVDALVMGWTNSVPEKPEEDEPEEAYFPRAGNSHHESDETDAQNFDD